MSDQSDYDKYLKGNYDPTGWKSPWRREFERRSAEEAMRPQLIVKAPQIKVRQERVRRERVGAPSRYNFPTGLAKSAYGKLLRAKWKELGLCGQCGAVPAVEGRYKCARCEDSRRRDYCRRAGKPYTPIIHDHRQCKECGKILNVTAKRGYCKAHQYIGRRELRRAA